jgi:chromate transporter
MSEPGESASHEFPREQNQGSLLEVLWVSTRLGLTSFGGPIAHLGYFHQEYVKRKQWIDEQSYADLVALCQFLPGPASSQVGIAIGIARARLLGGVAAWLGFTLPSALALIVFGLGIGAFADAAAGWLHGLKIVAVAVVAQAVWGMARSLAPDRERASLAILATIITLAWSSAVGQLLSIAIAGIAGVGVFSRHRFFYGLASPISGDEEDGNRLLDHLLCASHAATALQTVSAEPRARIV